MEIISCDAKEAIRKFKSGELQSASELKGEQITEAVEVRLLLFSDEKYYFFLCWIVKEILLHKFGLYVP